MASYQGGSVCAYRGCNSKSRNRSTSLFRFPKDIDRARVWLKACNREDLLSKLPEALYGTYRLCEFHFESTMFSNKSKLKKLLVPGAVPTIFPHCSKRKADDGNSLKEEAVELKLNIQSETQELPSNSFSVPSKSMQLSLPIRTRTLEPPSSSNMSEIKEIPSSAFSEEPSTSMQLAISCGTSAMEPPFSSNLSGDLRINVNDLNETTKSLLSPSAMTQTPASLSSKTPRKLKLREKLKSIKRKCIARNVSKTGKNISLDDFGKICDQFLSQNLADIVKIQARLEAKKAKGRRYTAEYKQFALTLHFLGPRAYNFLKKILYLPSRRSLERITEKIICKPGLKNESLFRTLEKKISTMLDQDKHCFLCVDEMSLKSNLFYHTGKDEIIGLKDYGNGSKEFVPANHATVIMIRGLYTNWKQPLAYFFVNETLKSNDLKFIIEQCILELTNLGLIIDAFVSDMGSNFVQFSKKMGVSPDNPIFMVGNKKIVYLFDTPHILKSTRNNLLKNIFDFDGKRTSWSHIRTFYEKDKKLVYRCAPKLTDSHISPTNFEKMKVKLATQVISNTVASGMNTYVSLGGLPANAIHTADVIAKFNNLFDILNSSVKKSPNKFKNVFEGEEYQIGFLNEMVMFLKQLRVFNQEGKNITSNVKFITSWLITINGMKHLWETLESNGFKYLKTRRVNQDGLENFFGSIRQQGGNCVNPTPIQFVRAFKKLFCQSYFNSGNANCIEDLDVILTDLKQSNLGTSIIDEVVEDSTESALTVGEYNYKTEELPTQNAFTYVCGYLIKKALNVHSCEVCVKFSKDSEDFDVAKLLTFFKAYDSDKSLYGGLRTPNEKFINYIYNLEKIFISMFDEVSKGNRISHIYFEKMMNVSFQHECPKFPKKYVVTLFIRMRIFYSLKYANREFKKRSVVGSKNKKPNRKIIILSHL